MATKLRSTSLYDVVVTAMADRGSNSSDILEAAKKQTVFEVLLNAMAAHKQKTVFVAASVSAQIKYFICSHSVCRAVLCTKS